MHASAKGLLAKFDSRAIWCVFGGVRQQGRGEEGPVQEKAKGSLLRVSVICGAPAPENGLGACIMSGAVKFSGNSASHGYQAEDKCG